MSSPALDDFLQKIPQLGLATILIEGEIGVGKEIVARTIHERSAQGEQPLLIVDCAALPETLSEADFLGMIQSVVAQVTTSGGSLLFDEVGCLSMPAQRALLDLLREEGIFRAAKPVRTRVLATTNQDLQEKVASERFLPDLYDHLRTARVRVPALRERPDEIPAIAAKILRKFEPRRPQLRFSRQAMVEMVNHSWPGNIRELENCVRRAALMARGNMIRSQDLNLDSNAPARPVKEAATTSDWRTLERDELLKVMARVNGNKRQAAALLKISRSTLNRKLLEFGYTPHATVKTD